MRFSDEQLMLLYARGRKEAFEELFHRHAARIHAYLARMLGHRGPDAEDLLQETFLRVARAADRYRPTARFTTWLFRLATNCCLNHLEARRRRPHLRLLRSGAHAPDEAAPSCSDPEERCQDDAGREALERAIANLPEKLRTVFLLRRESHLAYAEIAEVLSMPVGTVKTDLHRARLRLAAEVSEFMTDAAPAERARRG